MDGVFNSNDGSAEILKIRLALGYFIANTDEISETLAIIDLRSRWTYGDHCWSLAGGTDSVLTQGRIDAGSRLA